MTNDDELLTVAEVGAALGISAEGARRRIHSGDIPAIRLGGGNSHLRVRRGDLARYIRDHQVIR
jgi:excisionase family DNA binding protein